METFIASKTNIAPGHGMQSYSPGHIFWLLLLFLLIFFLGRRYKAMDEIGRRRTRLSVAMLILADEILKDAAMPLTGQWEWEFLPLHLCSISVFVVLIHALTGNRTVAEYLYAVTLPTASMAMVFPDWTGSLPFLNLMSFHSFSIHLMLVLYPALLLWGGFRPSARYLRRIAPVLVLMAFVMHFVNRVLGTDFFFVNGGGTGNPLAFLESKIGWWYLLAMPLIAAVCWLPMYLIPSRRKS